MRVTLVCLSLCLLAACTPRQAPATRGPAAAAGAPAATAAPASAAASAETLPDLRQGGYVIYLRHAQTASVTEPVLRDFTDCSWQRNLDAQGRAQAAAIGRHLRAAGLAAAVVEASPFCRTRETAEIVFGRPPRVVFDLFFHETHPPAEMAATVAKLKLRLGQRPLGGGNIALVGHAPALREVANVDLAEGQGVIVKPTGAGAFRVVARISETGISPAGL